MELNRLHQPLQYVAKNEANARVVIGNGPDTLDFCYTKFEVMPTVGSILVYTRGSFALAEYRVVQIKEERHPDTEQPLALVIVEFSRYV